jgi:hypothetical protein
VQCSVCGAEVADDDLRLGEDGVVCESCEKKREAAEADAEREAEAAKQAMVEPRKRSFRVILHMVLLIVWVGVGIAITVAEMRYPAGEVVDLRGVYAMAFWSWYGGHALGSTAIAVAVSRVRGGAAAVVATHLVSFPAVLGVRLALDAM